MSEGVIIKSDPNKTLAQIQAEVAAFEANPIDPLAPNVSTVPTEVIPAPVKPPEKATIPEPTTPPATEPAKPTQQPQETAEKAVSETPKTTEPVKEIDYKAAYEGLQRKYNKNFVEMRDGKEPEKAPAPVSETPLKITPEFKQKLLADLEKDPAEAIIEIARAVARQEINPVRSKVEASEFEKQEAAKLNGLDRLIGEGHEWLKTQDGLQKMEAALEQNPELWNTKDPYRAALGFISDIPSKPQQRSQAQTTGLTPILGAGGVVAPTVSTPAVSKENKLETMLAEVQRLQSRGFMPEANKILAEMERIERGY